MMERIETQEAIHAEERAKEKEARNKENGDLRDLMWEQFKAQTEQHAKERIQESERRERENEQVRIVIQNLETQNAALNENIQRLSTQLKEMARYIMRMQNEKNEQGRFENSNHEKQERSRNTPDREQQTREETRDEDKRKDNQTNEEEETNPSEEESSDESTEGNWQQGSAKDEDSWTEDDAQYEARMERERREDDIDNCHFYLRKEHMVTQIDTEMLEGDDLHAKHRYKWARIAEDFRRMYVADTTEQRRPQFIREWDKIKDAVKKLDEAAEAHRKRTGRKLNRPHVHIMESADRRHLESSENVPKQRFRRERLREYWKDYYKMTEKEQLDEDGTEQYVRIEKFEWEINRIDAEYAGRAPERSCKMDHHHRVRCKELRENLLYVHIKTKEEEAAFKSNNTQLIHDYKWDRIVERYLFAFTRESFELIDGTQGKICLLDEERRVKEVEDEAKVHLARTGQTLTRPYIHYVTEEDRLLMTSRNHEKKQRFRRERLQEYWGSYYMRPTKRQLDEEGLEFNVRLQRYAVMLEELDGRAAEGRKERATGYRLPKEEECSTKEFDRLRTPKNYMSANHERYLDELAWVTPCEDSVSQSDDEDERYAKELQATNEILANEAKKTKQRMKTLQKENEDARKAEQEEEKQRKIAEIRKEEETRIIDKYLQGEARKREQEAETEAKKKALADDKQGEQEESKQDSLDGTENTRSRASDYEEMPNYLLEDLEGNEKKGLERLTESLINEARYTVEDFEDYPDLLDGSCNSTCEDCQHPAEEKLAKEDMGGIFITRNGATHKMTKDVAQICAILMQPKYGTLQLKKAQRQDVALTTMINFLFLEGKGETKEGRKQPALKSLTQAQKGWFTKNKAELELSTKKILLKRVTGPDGTTMKRNIILPQKYQWEVMHEAHDMMGHQGENKTFAKIAEFFYFPGMREEIGRYVASCPKCQQSKGHNPSRSYPLKPIVTTRTNEMVEIDFEKLSVSKDGYIGLLVAVDHFSKYAMAYPMKEFTGKAAALALYEEWVLTFGSPEIIQSDQGSQFESELFAEFTNLIGSHKTRSTPYHPQTNGLVERQNRTLVGMLRVACSRYQDDWPEHVKKMCFAYNCSRHESTKLTPNMLMLNREVATPMWWFFPNYLPVTHLTHSEFAKKHLLDMPLMNELARHNMKEAQVRQKRNHDKKIKGQYEYKVGDLVMVYLNVVRKGNVRKLERQWRGPFAITRVFQEGRYFEFENGHKAHYSRLKMHQGRPMDMRAPDYGNHDELWDDMDEWTVIAPSDGAESFVEEWEASHASGEEDLQEPEFQREHFLRSREEKTPKSNEEFTSGEGQTLRNR